VCSILNACYYMQCWGLYCTGEADRLKEKYEDELKKNKEEIELLIAEIPAGLYKVERS
jgi:hypothetical protein